MRAWKLSSKILVIGFAVVLLGGCAGTAFPPPAVAPGPPGIAPGPSRGFMAVSPQDVTYVIGVENNTPFDVPLDRANNVLYHKGFQQVRSERQADFAVHVALFQEARDNPDLRGQQMLGGAALGAAAGAIIGAMTGAPGVGAIAGAAGGSVLGLAAPAATPIVKIAVQIHSFRTGRSAVRTVFVDMAHVSPYDVPRVIDVQVARMLDAMPAR